MYSINLRVNDHFQTSKRAIIVDNFYHDPHAVRAFALAQSYEPSSPDNPYVGRRTHAQFLFPGVRESFEELLGARITRWEEHGMNGRFQHNVAGDRLVYHCDAQRWAAMVYLTPDAPPSCGTSTYMHRATRIHHNSHPNIMAAFNQKTFLDATPYERVDSFGNIFNRLVIFDGGCIHAASEYFGSCIEDCCLWHMFFFDT
jgi:hypothetical protein